MRREWIQLAVSGLLQAVAMSGVFLWVLRGSEVPYRHLLVWGTPFVAAAAFAGAVRAFQAVRAWRRLVSVRRIYLCWKDLRT